MARLIWFLLTLISFVFIFTLYRYQGVPVDRDRFFVRMEKKAAEAKRLQEQMEAKRAAQLKALEAKKKPLLVLDTPELQNGYQVYFKKGKCITCHGKKGEGKSSQQAPKLAAQHDWYLYSTLVKFKKRERVNKKMDPYLRRLSNQDFQDVATYLSKLPAQ